ncbi:hypothetical protein Pelo_9666 [Pelomyxa schiedti]|nr:hypothetical protein Pelo_9666 [Pelomyxa schiedti]
MTTDIHHSIVPQVEMSEDYLRALSWCCRYLCIADVLHLSASCHALRVLALEEDMWRSLVHETFPNITLPPTAAKFCRSCPRPQYEIFKRLFTAKPFVWGSSSRNRLGIPGTKTFDSPVPLPLPPDFPRVKFFAKAQETGSCLITYDKRAYVWGNSIPQPTLLSNVKNAVHAYCGLSETVICTESGEVYVGPIGSVTHFTQIESQLGSDEKPIQCVTGQNQYSGVLTNQSVLILWRNTSTLTRVISSLPIARVKGSHRIFFAITTTGELFYWAPSTPTWQRVARTEGLVITDVDGGTNHYGFLTSTGQLYTWGDNSFGQLGQPTASRPISITPYTCTPEPVTWFTQRNIVLTAVNCGGYSAWAGGHTLTIDTAGHVYFFGSFNYTFTWEPQIMPFFEDRAVLSMMSGEDWAGVVVSAPFSSVEETKSSIPNRCCIC